MKRLTMILMAAALVLGAVSIASANCVPGKVFSTWDFNDPAYYYVYGYNNDGSGIGHVWEPGNRLNANEGTYDISIWLRPYGANFYISGDWGDARMSGCPSSGSPNVLTMSQGDGTFAVGQADETPAKGNFYNYGNLTFTPLPRPRVTSSSRSGSDVIVDLQFDAIDAGFSSRFGATPQSVIKEIVLFSFHGAADPGRDVGSGWTQLARIPYAGGGTSATAITVACANDGGDTFIGASLGVANELDLDHVSLSTQIECDPTLADPGDKFDLIRDRGKGKKKGRPFNR